VELGGATLVVISSIKFVHIATAALWWASAVMMMGQIRMAIDDNGLGLGKLREHVEWAMNLGRWCGPLTIASGFVMIFALGGFRAVSPAIHMALVLAIVSVAIEHGFAGKSWREFFFLLENEPQSTSLADAVTKLTFMNGLQHMFWVCMLILMVFKDALR